jgi:hypothetical protein
MSPVPVDPFPDFLVGAVANGDQIDARFLELYKTLNPAQRGIDKTNVALPGVGEDWMASGATGLAKGSFSAYRTAALALTTASVVPFDTEEWDVSGWHDTVTNIGRFTPLVAGVYRLSWMVHASGALTVNNWWKASLRKNGVLAKPGNVAWQVTTAALINSGGTADVQANGTTDFFDVIIEHNQGAGVAAGISPAATTTYFQGELVGRP